MKPTTPAVLALSTLVLVAAGCSSDSDDPPATTTPPTIEPSPNGGDSGVVTGQIDRMGRPGVSTALIRTDDDEDAYNANGDPGTWAAAFIAPMTERVLLIDGLDGTPGDALLNSSEQLTDLLLDDRLQIDTSTNVCNAYLGLEIGLGGCGGRALEIDVIDDTLRHLVSQGMPVSDLADGTEKVARLPGTWPFLAEALSN